MITTLYLKFGAGSARAAQAGVSLMMLLIYVACCQGQEPELSRTLRFKSPDEFAAVARAFRPAVKPSEFSYLFSAPEMGNDDTIYGKTVFAEHISEIAELYRSSDTCAFLVKAEPKTTATRSYVAGLFVLRTDDSGAWQIVTVERFYADGAGGWIECKVIRKPTSADGNSPPLTFRVTETDAGRHEDLEKRVYTLEYSGGTRLRPATKE